MAIRRMDLVSGYKGVVGLYFGNENGAASSEDSYVERLLDRISNGSLAEDRRAAISELQTVVAESHATQLAFGAMGFPVLLGVLREERDDMEMTCCRAASVLSHILKDNGKCKEKVIQIELEAPAPSLGASEPLLHRMVKYLALASSNKIKDGKPNWTITVVQPVILKLLVTWLANCPNAVRCFLDSRLHLTYLLELVSSISATVCTRGLAVVLLGECTLYNTSSQNGKDSFSIVDLISQKIGLTAYLLKFDEMQRSNAFSTSKTCEQRMPLTRSNAASMVDFEEIDDGGSHDKSDEDSPLLSFIFDGSFVEAIKGLEEKIRESIVEVTVIRRVRWLWFRQN